MKHYGYIAYEKNKNGEYMFVGKCAYCQFVTTHYPFRDSVIKGINNHTFNNFCEVEA